MPRPAKIPAALLIEDLLFWPRYTLDGQHVSTMAEALLAGDTLPPVVAERDSRRIVDGFHRTRATLKAYGPNAEIEVFWQSYADDAEMFRDAVKRNAAHGRKLTPFDHARITQRATELGISLETVAAMLHLRTATLKKESKFGKVKSNGTTRDAPLKRPLRYLEGQTLTEKQEAYNEGSSGWAPGFHANQLILAIEAGIPVISEGLRGSLLRLRELIDALELD